MILKQVIKYTNANALEATWVDAEDVVLLCKAYADTQMADFRADVSQYGGDIAEYEALIAEVEAAYVPPPPPAPPTPAQLQAEVVAATQKRLDDFARTRNYDGILSAATYATSAVPKFQAEGQYAVNARDATWSTLYTFLADVLAGNRPMPTGFADVEPLLPALEWPQ